MTQACTWRSPFLAVALLFVSFGAESGDLERRSTEKLNSNTDWTDHNKTARLCILAIDRQLKPDAKQKCVEGLEKAAKEHTGSNPPQARKELNRAIQLGLPKERATRMDAALRKAEKGHKAKVDAQEAKNMGGARKTYGEVLRQKFLDDNLDIKVFVDGTGNRKITLKYVLFNDVWANKMRKGELIQEMRDMGFTRLTMTDGYDYNVYWDLK